jgi:HrpA-like RNA helicase
MAEYSDPEILKVPLEQTLLQLKAIGVEDLI